MISIPPKHADDVNKVILPAADDKPGHRPEIHGRDDPLGVLGRNNSNLNLAGEFSSIIRTRDGRKVAPGLWRVA
jgi:hypothetical protein